MNKNAMRFFQAALAAVTLAVALPSSAQQAQKPAGQTAFPGTITLKNQSQVRGVIRWMPQGRKYVVATRKGEQTLTTDVPVADVAGVEVPKPEKLDAAIAAVKAGRAAAAIPVLEDIVKRYQMLGWDKPAARVLAQAKLDTGDAATAIAICEAIVKGDQSAAYLGDLAPVYWAALLKTGKKARLEELLAKAVANGEMADSAAALVMRGDILMDEKRPFDALKDGYLRTVMLYERCPEVQPEAMYKAAKAFEALSKNADAQRMRDMLKKRFPKSEYASKP